MQKKNELSDEELLQLACAGQEWAFAVLFDRYDSRLKGRLMWKNAEETLAEDVIQESWIKIWTGCTKYLALKPGDFVKFMNTVVRNVFIDRLRAERSRGRGNHVGLQYEEEEEEGADFVVDPETIEALVDRKDASHHLNEQQRRDLLERALSQLPQEQRIAVLYLLRGHSIKDIAQMTGEHPEAIKTRIRYGIAKLKQWTRGYLAHD